MKINGVCRSCLLPMRLSIQPAEIMSGTTQELGLERARQEEGSRSVGSSGLLTVCPLIMSSVLERVPRDQSLELKSQLCKYFAG